MPAGSWKNGIRSNRAPGRRHRKCPSETRKRPHTTSLAKCQPTAKPPNNGCRAQAHSKALAIPTTARRPRKLPNSKNMKPKETETLPSQTTFRNPQTTFRNSIEAKTGNVQETKGSVLATKFDVTQIRFTCDETHSLSL